MRKILLGLFCAVSLSACGSPPPSAPEPNNDSIPVTPDNIDKVASLPDVRVDPETGEVILPTTFQSVFAKIIECSRTKEVYDNALLNSVGALAGDELTNIKLETYKRSLDTCKVEVQDRFDRLPEGSDSSWKYNSYKEMIERL